MTFSRKHFNPSAGSVFPGIARSLTDSPRTPGLSCIFRISENWKFGLRTDSLGPHQLLSAKCWTRNKKLHARPVP